MKIIGFNFTKISAGRKPGILKQVSVNTNIEFLNIEKEKLDILKEGEPLRIDFKFSVVYAKADNKEKKVDAEGEISFEGNIVLSASSDESKEIMKGWKKREISPGIKMSLFNVVLKKCSVKALALEEELGLPPHIGLPQIKAKKE